MDANYGIMEGQTPMTSDMLSENDELNLDDFPKGSVRIEDENDDEFSKLLDQFLKEGMEVVDEKPDAEDDEDEEDPEEDVEEDPEEEFFPNGEIEQNLNVNVKVDILRPIANPREELDKLVGCADIKRRMDELVALTSYNKMMRDLFPGSKQHEVSLHSVFLGRPGTGKTTVCKIFGSLLRKVGALSKGHVVVCDRGTFIGTLWGDEERSMKQVLKMAQGGVLMIDEAYLLASKNENDPGRLVIQLLMNVLADETQRDIAVVLCGYKEPMMKLLDSNPGLYSRFPNKFEFADFTVDELLEITQCRVKDYDYQFTAKAWEKYRQVLLQAYQVRNPETWGNARFVANQLERIYIQHATRCVKHQPKDKRELLKITPEDILPIEVPRQKAKIGF
jgi:SpoVK/Ycf46/Vps4 family AAA+-type ATPase